MRRHIIAIFSFEIIAAITAFSLTLLSIAPTVITAIKTPQSQVFTGMYGYSDDYIGYTSFIKEGLYGRNFMVIRSLPKPQGISTIHLAYVWIGKIFGVMIKNAPMIYHVARFIFGLLFVLLTLHLFLSLLRDKSIALLSTVIAFTAGPLGYFYRYGHSLLFKPIAQFKNFSEDANARATTRPHYLLGAILFLLCLQLLNKNVKLQTNKTRLLLFSLSLLTSIIHLPTGTVLMCLSVALSIRIIFYRSYSLLFPAISCFLGAATGLVLSQWSMHQYPYINLYPSIPPSIANAPLLSIASLSLFDYKSIIPDILTFGPLLWFGSIGLIMPFISKTYSKEHITVTLWFIIQMSLFFFLYPFLHVERVRFIQTLYFIPLAYGIGILISALKKNLSRWSIYIFVVVLFIAFLPNYYFAFKQNVYSYTDYRNFNIFAFPTINQHQAFVFLDKSTPQESRVIASYEASNLILLYSHNFVWGNPQNWMEGPREEMVKGKDYFFWGHWSDQEALDYLQSYDIKYVYYGYQEKALGDITHYQFLKPIFTNSEVTIFEVKIKEATLLYKPSHADFDK